MPHSALDLGIVLTPGDAAGYGEPAVAVLRRGISLDLGVSVLQSRRAADRREPRRPVLSCGAGVRIGDGDRLSRRAPAIVSHHRLCAGADRRFRCLAQAGEYPLGPTQAAEWIREEPRKLTKLFLPRGSRSVPDGLPPAKRR